MFSEIFLFFSFSFLVCLFVFSTDTQEIPLKFVHSCTISLDRKGWLFLLLRHQHMIIPISMDYVYLTYYDIQLGILIILLYLSYLKSYDNVIRYSYNI